MSAIRPLSHGERCGWRSQAFFRLPGVGLVEKDLHVVRAIAALAAVDAAPFTLIFGGGTALRARIGWCAACRRMWISRSCRPRQRR